MLNDDQLAELMDKITDMTDREQLRQVNKVVVGMLRALQDRKGISVKATLKVGERVHLHDKDNQHVTLGTGKVQRLNPKRAKVVFVGRPATSYSVPYNMLEKGEHPANPWTDEAEETSKFLFR